MMTPVLGLGDKRWRPGFCFSSIRSCALETLLTSSRYMALEDESAFPEPRSN